MEWKELRSEEDIDELLKIFGGFHDGCLREIHFWNSCFVDEDRTFYTGYQKQSASILFQRQWSDPSAIEVQFDDVKKMHIETTPSDYLYMISDCVFILKDDLFYWADSERWKFDDPYKMNISWISATCVKWRDRSGWMGSKLHYGECDRDTYSEGLPFCRRSGPRLLIDRKK